MMRCFLLALALLAAAVTAQTPQTVPLEFVFSIHADDTQLLKLPFDFDGNVTFSLLASAESALMFCMNWLVPAEVPTSGNLTAIWLADCPYSYIVDQDEDRSPVSFSVPLRADENYISLAILNEEFDFDSTGAPVLTVDVDADFNACEKGFFGTDCGDSYIPIVYEGTAHVTQSQVPTYFTLPVASGDQNGNFVRGLKLNFPAGLVNSSVFYRLNGPLLTGDAVSDGHCFDLSNCVVNAPPLTTVNDYFWVFQVVSPVVNFTFTQVFCNPGSAGSTCVKLTTLSTAIGTIYEASGPNYFVLAAPDLNIAVGGLDGYEQTALAPTLTFQVDNTPELFALSTTSGAQVNRFDTTFDYGKNATNFIVYVDAKGDFGIWRTSPTVQCPTGCDLHGTCNPQTLVCECTDPNKYNGLACEHEIKKFTIEYIILIAVGGILVLSIVIGVPIYCYMNRHPAEYETVE